MDITLVQSLIEQREAINKKFDDQIMQALGIAPPGVSIGISMDDVGVADGESFTSLPSEVIPTPGFYVLGEKITGLSFSVEVVEVSKADTVKLNWQDDNHDRTFELPLIIFNRLFVKMDDYIL